MWELAKIRVTFDIVANVKHKKAKKCKFTLITQ